MEFSRPKNGKFPVRHTLFGVLLGSCFPLVSTLIASYDAYGTVRFDHLVSVQRGELLLWVIDSAPFFLGLAFYIAGKYQQKAIENQKMQQVAEASDEAKSAFLSNMSHEIRTPITTIIGSIELLQNIDVTKDQKEHYDTIKTTADLLLNIVNNILDLSKIEANKVELEQAPFSLENVLMDSLKLVSHRACVKNIDILCEVDPQVPDRLIGDRVRLHQILVNLLSNAVKFTAKGKVEIRVGNHVSDDLKTQLRISVEDTGIGMDEAQQRRVFEAFGQADASITRRFAGTGLGLTICKQLAEAMGGSISVKSKPMQGSTFTVTPCFALPPETEKEKASPPASLRDIPVLVIDACQRNRQIVFRILEQAHLIPLLADNCEQGLQAIEQAQQKGRPIRLVLLDAMIAQTDMADFLQQLNNGDTAKPIAILMQTKGVPAPLASGQRQAAATISKPILRRALLERLEQLLTQSGDATPVSQRPTPPPTNLAGKSILVVEDNEVNRAIFIKMLTTKGCRCDGATDGHHAVQLALQKKFDLIFMDLHMPRMGGIEAIQRIRALEPEGVHTPIIALTADVISGVKDECLTAGFDAFLTKPVRINDLFDLLQEHALSQSPTDGRDLKIAQIT